MKIFFSGVNDSLTLLAFRFSSIKAYQKALVFLFLLAGFVFVASATQTNNLIRTIMTISPGDTPGSDSLREAQGFLQTYLQMYTSGEADWLVAIVVGFLISSVLFVPFSGYVIHGMVSHTEMVIVKDNNNYKIGDSFLFQVISSFTLIQLVGLTVGAQLITFDSTHSAYAVFFAWSVWLFVSLLTVAFSWLVEYVVRMYGSRVRFIFISIFTFSIAAILFVDPNHGRTLFGAAEPIYMFVNEIASGNLAFLLYSFATVAVLSLGAIAVISLLASQALRIPEPLTVSSTTDKQVKGTTLPINPLGMFWRTLWRHKTVIKPIFVAVGFSTIIVILLRGQTGIITTMIVIPLAVGIAVGANVFGLLSGASSWLLSMSQWRKRVFFSATALIFSITILSYTFVYGIGTITTLVAWENILYSLPGLLVIVVVTTVVSLWLSLRKPLPFSGKARENLVSSPTALIGYVFIYMVTAGMLGNITMNMPFSFQPWFAAIIILINALIYMRLYYKWVHTEKYASRMLTTTNSG